MENKRCCRCKKFQLIIEFTKDKQTNDGLCAKCKTCVTKYNKEKWQDPIHQKASKIKRARWQIDNKFKAKNTVIKRKYGISLDEYNKLLLKQNNVCAFCFNPETVFDKRTNKTKALSIDHNHLTRKIRGLLCSNCNMNLVGANTLETAIKLIDYLNNSL